MYLIAGSSLPDLQFSWRLTILLLSFSFPSFLKMAQDSDDDGVCVDVAPSYVVSLMEQKDLY